MWDDGYTRLGIPVNPFEGYLGGTTDCQVKRDTHGDHAIRAQSPLDTQRY